ncbi:hypothetical protein BaRGS_00037929 [Batillaria attramentaria]|uniref:Uncharacterized protein n=1 Tax=Batillaria attramentaria TaxID=370345 RepID=A0ABD0J7Q3_9CAEN
MALEVRKRSHRSPIPCLTGFELGAMVTSRRQKPTYVTGSFYGRERDGTAAYSTQKTGGNSSFVLHTNQQGAAHTASFPGRLPSDAKTMNAVAPYDDFVVVLVASLSLPGGGANREGSCGSERLGHCA